MTTARAVIKSLKHQKPEQSPTFVRKQRGARRTKLTPNHRCFVCDHHDQIANAPEGSMMAWYRRWPNYGCRYLNRIAVS